VTLPDEAPSIHSESTAGNGSSNVESNGESNGGAAATMAAVEKPRAKIEVLN
jgi:hypothetical protein